MPPLSNKATVYTSLLQLGLTIGSETIDAIIAALPNKSSLWMAVNTEVDGYNPTQYPYKYGYLQIDRLWPNRVSIIYIAPNPRMSNTAEHWIGQFWGGNFNGWVRQATAEPSIEYNLPLTSGVTAYTKSMYSKTQENLVVLNVSVNIIGYNDGFVVGILPDGYRPAVNNVAVACSVQKGVERAAGVAIVSQSGVITAHAAITGDIRVLFTVTFLAM